MNVWMSLKENRWLLSKDFWIEMDLSKKKLGFIHVQDTSTSTLEQEIFLVISNHKLDVQNIWEQGYDQQVI